MPVCRTPPSTATTKLPARITLCGQQVGGQREGLSMEVAAGNDRTHVGEDQRIAGAGVLVSFVAFIVFISFIKACPISFTVCVSTINETYLVSAPPIHWVSAASW